VSEQVTTNKVYGRRPTVRKTAWIVLVSLAVILVIVLLLTLQWNQPTYSGRTFNAWFEQAVSEQGPTFTQSESYKAFIQMEGDAVPFLAEQLKLKSPLAAKSYVKLVSWLPSIITTRLPPSRSDSYYRARCQVALDLLQGIGSSQRWKSEAGVPSAKPSVSVALPGVFAALKDSSMRVQAAQTVWFIGPLAADAIPDLTQLAMAGDRPDEGGFIAIQALGMMRSLASNAMPQLCIIAQDKNRTRGRLHAVVALGRIGPSARSAVPVLREVLTETNQELRVASLRSIAEIGFTPDELVPTLLDLKQSTNDWVVTLASLALWNHDRHDSKLQEELTAALASEKRGWLLSSLITLGTNAAPLIQAVRPLTNDSDANIRRFAKLALKEMEASSP
jgi:hypothetical protein